MRARRVATSPVKPMFKSSSYKGRGDAKNYSDELSFAPRQSAALVAQLAGLL